MAKVTIYLEAGADYVRYVRLGMEKLDLPPEAELRAGVELAPRVAARIASHVPGIKYRGRDCCGDAPAPAGDIGPDTGAANAGTGSGDTGEGEG